MNEKATLYRLNLRKLRRLDKGYSEAWCRGSAAPIYSREERKRMFENLVSYGTMFLEKLLGKNEDVFLALGYQTPLSLRLRGSRAKVGVLFDNEGTPVIDYVKTFHKSDEGGDELLRKVIDSLREAGHSRILFHRPEYTPYYADPVWLEDLAKGRQFTVFQLREMLCRHQDRMNRQFYTVAGRFGFKKIPGNEEFLVLQPANKPVRLTR